MSSQIASHHQKRTLADTGPWHELGSNCSVSSPSAEKRELDGSITRLLLATCDAAEAISMPRKAATQTRKTVPLAPAIGGSRVTESFARLGRLEEQLRWKSETVSGKEMHVSDAAISWENSRRTERT